MAKEIVRRKISVLEEKKPEDKQTFIDEMKEDAMMGFIEGLIPKLEPMIQKASEKLKEYFGDDEKIFMIKRKAGSSPQVIVLSNLKGKYLISNETRIEGDEIISENEFRATNSSVIDVYDTGEFVTKLLSGEFTKQ